jgi:quinol monooxygenase YgiN
MISPLGEKGAGNMVSLIVRFRFASEDRAEIAEMVKQLAAASRSEDGCITFIPHHLVDDPDVVLIYEQYRDEKAMSAHRQTEHFKKYVAGGLYQKMRERTLENLHALV